MVITSNLSTDMIDAPGMKGIRSRNPNGPLREKRGDTHISTIEKEYNVNFGVRDDMHLQTLLDQNKVDSIKKLLKKYR